MGRMWWVEDRTHLRQRAWLAALMIGACLAGVRAEGTVSVLSTSSGAVLGGLTYRDGDLVQYDDVTDTATLFFSEDLFSASENVDAVHVLANGTILLSTVGPATLGGLTFSDGDVAAYDPVSGTASLFFNENLLLNGANLDALAVLDNGHLVISTEIDSTLAGLAFRDGDLIEYDAVGNVASLFLNEDLFTDDEDVDGVHVLADGTIILSTDTGATIGGLTFRDGDLIRYDPVSGISTLEFDEDAFVGNENIDAVFVVPEPGAGSLLAFGLALLVRRRR